MNNKMKYQKPETEIILLESEENVMVVIMSLDSSTTPNYFPGTSNSTFFKNGDGILGGEE